MQFTLPLALFIALLVLQLIPLPAAVLQHVSPSTYALYNLFHPDWPNVRSTLSLHPYATYMEFTKFLAYAGLFCCTINILRSRRRIRYVSLAIVGVATGMALIGIVQHLAGMTAVYGWRDASYTNFFGPFLNRNHFAAYQSMAILLGLGLFLAPTAQTSPVPSPLSLRVWLSHPSTGQRLLLLFALSVMTGALVLSLSRGGVIGFLAGLALLLLLLRQHRAGNRTRMLLALVVLAAMSLWLGLTPLLERFMHNVHGGPTLTWGERLSVYQATWNITQDFPLFGIGLEAFPVIFPRYQPTDVRLHYLQAHNDVLQLLAETGWIGFLSLLGSLLSLITAIVKRWRQRHDPFVHAIVPAGLAAFCAIALQSFVDFSLRIPANALLLTVILALTFACANLPRHGLRHGERQHEV
ncbi:MAG: O-antigen ligase family protein [Candidatus Tectomicrobia bacterium]|nr:O-antigen ligase family protein [Candidatus Tectomicrobia bacterium]